MRVLPSPNKARRRKYINTLTYSHVTEDCAHFSSFTRVSTSRSSVDEIKTWIRWRRSVIGNHPIGNSFVSRRQDRDKCQLSWESDAALIWSRKFDSNNQFFLPFVGSYRLYNPFACFFSPRTELRVIHRNGIIRSSQLYFAASYLQEKLEWASNGKRGKSALFKVAVEEKGRTNRAASFSFL